MRLPVFSGSGRCVSRHHHISPCARGGVCLLQHRVTSPLLIPRCCRGTAVAVAQPPHESQRDAAVAPPVKTATAAPKLLRAARCAPSTSGLVASTKRVPCRRLDEANNPAVSPSLSRNREGQPKSAPGLFAWRQLFSMAFFVAAKSCSTIMPLASPLCIPALHHPAAYERLTGK